MAMHESLEFVKACQLIGKDRHLVQAAGGNISLKISNRLMVIKSSGVDLSEVTRDNGYCIVDYNLISDYIKSEKNLTFSLKAEKKYNSALLKSLSSGNNLKPSIEAGFHALLDKAIIHTHPILVNSILCSKNAKDIMNNIFGKNNFGWVPYETPGIGLSKGIDLLTKKFADENKPRKIMFLENHGLIVCGKKLSECVLSTKNIIKSIKDYFKIENLSLNSLYNFKYFKIENSGSKKFKSNPVKIFMKNPDNMELLNGYVFPDSVVYCHCGFSFNKASANKIALYDDGSVVLPQNSAINPEKMMETLAAWVSLLLLMNQFSEPKYISEQECNNIKNMESEKYRQKVG